MTKKRIIDIFKEYVLNDYKASQEEDYIKDALLAVADEYEIRELGFGWVLDNEDPKNY